jgi:hypothetical protein
MNHASQRLIERIVSQNTLDIVKEGSTASYTKVGEYNLTQLVKDQIVSKVESIKSMDFGNRDYGVLVHNFGKVVRTPDMKSESNGDSLYAIVRNNEIFTICFVKSYTGFQNGLEGKLRVDAIIKKLSKFKKR